MVSTICKPWTHGILTDKQFIVSNMSVGVLRICGASRLSTILAFIV